MHDTVEAQQLVVSGNPGQTGPADEKGHISGISTGHKNGLPAGFPLEAAGSFLFRAGDCPLHERRIWAVDEVAAPASMGMKQVPLANDVICLLTLS